MSLSSPPEKPIGLVSPSRPPTRVKPFPAGNTSTSASRIAFLNSLCQVSKFSSLVNLVQHVVGILHMFIGII
jgi:hypothetical protein